MAVKKLDMRTIHERHVRSQEMEKRSKESAKKAREASRRRDVALRKKERAAANAVRSEIDAVVPVKISPLVESDGTDDDDAPRDFESGDGDDDTL